MNDDNINDYVPSILNPRCVKKQYGDVSLTQNSVISRCSLSLRRNNATPKSKLAFKTPTFLQANKENSPNLKNSSGLVHEQVTKNVDSVIDTCSIGFSAIEDLGTVLNEDEPFNFSDIEIVKHKDNKVQKIKNTKINDTDVVVTHICNYIDDKNSLISVSSATELHDTKSDDTVLYEVLDTPQVSVNFQVKNCKRVEISSKKSAIKRIAVSYKYNDTNVDCDVIECSQLSTETVVDENMNTASLSPRKRLAVSVNLEIKKQKLSEGVTEENSKVLILNTNGIENISHVIVQPPNYKLVKRIFFDKNKPKGSLKRNSRGSGVNNGNVVIGAKLRQKSLESYFRKSSIKLNVSDERAVKLNDRIDNGRDEVMSKNSGVADAVKFERGRLVFKGIRKGNDSPRSGRLPSTKRDFISPRDVKTSSSDAPRGISPKTKNDSVGSLSPRKNVDSLHFNIPQKPKANKISPRNIPHHKIVAGTHFAVDAFSYGEIPNVKHYFLTHFHSDHYSGLKKGFNKLLFCSKITADLSISRLGVNPKCIHTISVDETIQIDGIEVTAVEANHCPGALMLVFALPNGKTLLHTGDFRASPIMESYPIFWNKDIHTVYLDTTYCNPRYDFPTQDQSLEMALYILRQKKLALEKAGKKFSQVLIVCGTYTIGKEKFFIGMARRVGCSVWACPEKDRVLQTVEGRSFGHAAPDSCQLHVVPMRDLTHEKLRSYLDSLQGAFTEVVAFKPSGWENGKNSSVEKDNVTIHGIPYSEHSSFSEIIRFVKFLKPRQVVPTVDISGGVKAVQKYFPCPLVYKEDLQSQSKVTDYFSINNRQPAQAVT